MPLIAMDLGGTKLATALFDDAGELLHRESVPIAGRQGDAVGALVADRYAAMRQHLGEAGVAALGVAVPGIHRTGRGTVWAPNVPGWENYPLRERLAHAAGPNVPIVIDSDRAAYIMGETWRGAARGARDAIFLAVGTGIGAGILAGGQLLRGHSDIAGAIGWLALDRPFRAEYRACGCFEHHASGPGMVKVARALLAAHPEYDGELREVEPAAITPTELFGAVERDDPIATRVVEDAIEFWAMAAANLVSLFNPEVIVFGGGVFGPAARFIDRIRDEAILWAQPVAVRETAFVTSTLGADAALYGAARLAMLADAPSPLGLA